MACTITHLHELLQNGWSCHKALLLSAGKDHKLFSFVSSVRVHEQ